MNTYSIRKILIEAKKEAVKLGLNEIDEKLEDLCQDLLRMDTPEGDDWNLLDGLNNR